jgi:hypothetical protein
MGTLFKKWLSETEVTVDIPGHLIGDLKADDELPDNIESAQQLRDYMKRVGACHAVLKAVPVVWKRYERWRARQGGDR